MSETFDDLISELVDAVMDRSAAYEWGSPVGDMRVDAAKAALRTALAAAERAGAEKALNAIQLMADSGELAEWLPKLIRTRLAALFPPPGAEVGRG